MTKTKNIKLKDIVIDAGTQQREKINDEIVAEYSEAMRCGTQFPAVTVFFNSVEYYLADGFHRFFACKSAGIEEISAEIIEGTKRDAKYYSLGANKDHGLRRSNGDKKKAVIEMITDAEWGELPSRDIGNHIGVSHAYVSKIRRDLEEIEEKKLGNVSKNTPKPALNRDDDQKLSTGLELSTEQNAISETDKESNHAELEHESFSDFDPVAELESAHQEIDRLTKIIESDDQLSAAMAENKRLTELCRVLEDRARGFQSSENDAVRKAKMWKKKFEDLEKQVKASGLVSF